MPHIPDDARIVPLSTRGIEHREGMINSARIIPDGSTPQLVNPDDGGAILRRAIGSATDRIDAARIVPRDVNAQLGQETGQEILHRPARFVTSRGSVYTLGPDGRYQRFKTATGESLSPMGITVFLNGGVNNYDNMRLQRAMLVPEAIRIIHVDEQGNDTALHTLRDLTSRQPGSIFVVCPPENGQMLPSEKRLPASLYPQLGDTPFEIGMTDSGIVEAHIGNDIVEIG